MHEDYRPRFTFEISSEQKERADRFIGTYGLRRAVFGKVLDDVLDLIEEYGTVAIGIMMSDTVKPRDVLPKLSEVVTHEGRN